MEEFLHIMTLVGIIASSWLLGAASYALIELIFPRKH